MDERTKLRGKLTYANLMATIAVFIALGGSAYGATHLPKNSVGTKQIKNGAVTSAKVKRHSLLASNFKAGQLPAGPRGAQGPKGDPGPAGKTNAVVRYGPQRELSNSAASASFAPCNPGEAVTGGGYEANPTSSSSEFVLRSNRPANAEEAHKVPAEGTPAAGWYVSIENNTGFKFKFRSYVMCASP
jgi:hypothetical protein